MANPAKYFSANGTIRIARFVKLDTSKNNNVIEGTANAEVIGISKEAGNRAPIPENTTDPPNAAIAGESVEVYQVGEECLLFAGSGGWTAGDRLKSGSAGEGLSLAGTSGRVGAIALETVSANEYGLVQVFIYDKLKTAS